MMQEIRNDQGEVRQVQTASKPAGIIPLTQTGWEIAFAAPIILAILAAALPFPN